MNPLSHKADIRQMSYRYANQRMSAEDARQELYLTFLELPDDTDVKYAFAVAKNHLIDAVKSKRYNYSYRDKFLHWYMDGADINWDDTDTEQLHRENPDVPSFESLRIDNVEDRAVVNVTVSQLWDSLTDRERILIHGRFWEGLNQKELGKVLGVSRSMVSYMLTSVLAKMRKSLEVEMSNVEV